ncbi:hypothetical protein O181_038870 [Austropuccinia psidii MF-1]|uniref:Uncharacterized protein n=1 Tax=Austropuccinia psidii MF-1 TaxID=1389203 RepID=A0A9Q3DAJ2_9BASI|nr:hypothetical protein [Austropuccinia psidii MF-1]
MGMPPSVDDFPPNSTNDEEKFHIHWVKNCAKHIKTHLETFEYGLRDYPINQCKYLIKQESTSISQLLQPPEFKPSHDIINSKIKVSIVEKRACEKECQLVGLKRITFQWGTSFNNSTWNAAIANIISNNFFNWCQTQPSLNIDNTNQINLLIERWVNGRGQEMKNISKLGQAAEEGKFQKAKEYKNTRGRQNARAYSFVRNTPNSNITFIFRLQLPVSK